MIAVGPGDAGRSRVTVIGCGHVGVVMAAGLARLGHEVLGMDIDPRRVDELSNGEPIFHEPGLRDLLQDGLAAGRLRFTTSHQEAVPDAQFIFLAVDTPATPSGAADLRNVRSAARAIASALNGGSPIIVNKSTSPIGTGETIESILRAGLAGHGGVPRIVSNPEFLRQGRAVEDFFHPDRIVVGARNLEDAYAVAALYGPLTSELLITDLRTAEMIKYVANSFLATRISFINEVARLCEQIGVDVDEVVDGVARDPRIGAHFFQPGIGFGGSCLPKDVAALRYVGETFGVATPVLSAVQEVNQAQRTSAVRKLRHALGTLEGAVIAAWGLTFKGGTEDVRDSPARDVVELLLNEGAVVRIYDPSISPGGLSSRLASLVTDSPLEAAKGADALAILTDWPEFGRVELPLTRAVMAGDVLFDGRNVLERSAAEAAGFRYIGVGRGRALPTTSQPTRPAAVA